MVVLDLRWCKWLRIQDGIPTRYVVQRPRDTQYIIGITPTRDGVIHRMSYCIQGVMQWVISSLTTCIDGVLHQYLLRVLEWCISTTHVVQHHHNTCRRVVVVGVIHSVCGVDTQRHLLHHRHNTSYIIGITPTIDGVIPPTDVVCDTVVEV